MNEVNKYKKIEDTSIQSLELNEIMITPQKQHKGQIELQDEQYDNKTEPKIK